MDKNLPTKPLQGPFRMFTDFGDLFIWLDMGTKDRDRILGFVKLWFLDPLKPTTNASLHRLVPHTHRDQAELLTSNLTFWPGIEPLM